MKMLSKNAADELNDAGDQIVIVGFGDPAAVEASGRWRIPVGKVVDEDLAVNFRCVHGRAPFEQKLALIRSAFQQQVEFAADQLLFLLLADLPLDAHEMFASAFDLPRRKLLFLGI